MPAQPFIAGELQLTGNPMVVVSGCHQQSSMVSHCHSPTSLQSKIPTHSSIPRDVQIRVLRETQSCGAMGQDQAWGRGL